MKNKHTIEQYFEFDTSPKLVNIYDSQVYEIIDFLSDEEQQLFFHIAKNSEEKDWPLIVDNKFVKNDPGISGRNFSLDSQYEKEREKINKKIQSMFENYTSMNNIAAIQRYQPNQNMGVHTDNLLEPEVQFGMVIYLNDNYDGGEINYPSLNLTIKPKAKSLIIHPAKLEHQVLTVKGKETRYIFSSFVRGDNKTKVKIYGQ